MQISKETISLLSNFSEINTSIVIKTGNELKTISDMKNILARTTVKEDFPLQFAIYDLPEFLNLASSSIFQGADYDLGDESLQIEKDDARVTYWYAAEEIITSAPDKNINMPEGEVSFTLTKSKLKAITKMEGVLKKPDLAILSSGENITLSVYDKKDPTSNTFNLDAGLGNGDTFSFLMKVHYLSKLLEGDYDVIISSENISHFSHKDLDLDYWIAIEPDSTYNGKSFKKPLKDK